MQLVITVGVGIREGDRLDEALLLHRHPGHPRAAARVCIWLNTQSVARADATDGVGLGRQACCRVPKATNRSMVAAMRRRSNWRSRPRRVRGRVAGARYEPPGTRRRTVARLGREIAISGAVVAATAVTRAPADSSAPPGCASYLRLARIQDAPYCRILAVDSMIVHTYGRRSFGPPLVALDGASTVDVGVRGRRGGGRITPARFGAPGVART